MLTCNVEPAPDIPGYVALCSALVVASQGATIDEAERNIREAVLLYLVGIDEVGELDRIFAERGLKVLQADSFKTQQVRTVDGNGVVFADLFPIEHAA